MGNSKHHGNGNYIMYITCGRNKKTSVGIADEMYSLPGTNSNDFSRIVYYEKFNDRKKAVNRKRLLQKTEKSKIYKLVTKHNPEWLNLIFTMTDEFNYQIKLNH